MVSYFIYEIIGSYIVGLRNVWQLIKIKNEEGKTEKKQKKKGNEIVNVACIFEAIVCVVTHGVLKWFLKVIDCAYDGYSCKGTLFPPQQKSEHSFLVSIIFFRVQYYYISFPRVEIPLKW